jgi:predicted Rossmann fold nucleotide-binding protein DprA/Smf involved in DNA uptake
MIPNSEVSEIDPPADLARFFRGKPPKLWGVGDPAILSRRLLGVISARQIDSDLALKSSQLLKELASLDELAFVGGWHSPLEEEAFHILAARMAPIVFCVSKALNRVVLSDDLESRVRRGQILLLTHCSPKAKRISRDASIRRNELLRGLVAGLLVLSAPAGSASLTLAKSGLRHGQPVFTPDHRMNKDLLACGVLPATFENVRAALR